MKHFKLYLAIGSLVFLVINLYGFYFLSDYLQKNEMEFCKINYCFKLLSIGEFISIIIAIIGIVGVILSFDSWKFGQKYNDEINRYKIAIDQAKKLKNQLISINLNRIIIVDEAGYIELLGKLSETETEFKYFKLNVTELKKSKKESFEYFLKVSIIQKLKILLK